MLGIIYHDPRAGCRALQRVPPFFRIYVLSGENACASAEAGSFLTILHEQKILLDKISLDKTPALD
jgi:hypothetical protein